jgi:hypothetical protein
MEVNSRLDKGHLSSQRIHSFDLQTHQIFQIFCYIKLFVRLITFQKSIITCDDVNILNHSTECVCQVHLRLKGIVKHCDIVVVLNSHSPQFLFPTVALLSYQPIDTHFQDILQRA